MQSTSLRLTTSPTDRPTRHDRARTSLVTPPTIDARGSSARPQSLNRQCVVGRAVVVVIVSKQTLLQRTCSDYAMPAGRLSTPLPLLPAVSGRTRHQQPLAAPDLSSFPSKISSVFRKWTKAAGLCSEYDFDVVVTSYDDVRG